MLGCQNSVRRGRLRGSSIVAIAASFATVSGLHSARAAAPESGLTDRLLGIYARYDKDIVAGNLVEAASLRTAKTRGDLLAETKKSPKELADDLEFMRGFVPDSVALVHANRKGDEVTLVTRAAKTMPTGVPLNNGLKSGQVVRSELTLIFDLEGGDWKLGDNSFGPDQASIKHCHDAAKETVASYDQSQAGNEGGQIRRVTFGADHTLVVFDIVNEENCMILPDRAWLTAHGSKPETIVPWATIEADGYTHHTDKQRFWAQKWTVTPE